MKIGLISCTKAKKTYKCPAEEMYSDSSLFRLAFEYCKKHYERVYILSAKYFLLDPQTLIIPYDISLNQMDKKERENWSEKVLSRLGRVLKKNDEVYFHAGLKYRAFLIKEIEKTNKCFVPLKGLGIGKQLNFYKQALSK